MAGGIDSHTALASAVEGFVTEARVHVYCALEDRSVMGREPDHFPRYPSLRQQIEVAYDSGRQQPLSFLQVSKGRNPTAEPSLRCDPTYDAVYRCRLDHAARRLEAELRKIIILDHPDLRFGVQFPAQSMHKPPHFAFGLETWWQLKPEDMTAEEIATAIYAATDKVADFCGFSPSDDGKGRKRLSLWNSQFRPNTHSIRAGNALEALGKDHIFAAHRIGPQFAPEVRSRRGSETLTHRGVNCRVNPRIVSLALTDLVQRPADRVGAAVAEKIGDMIDELHVASLSIVDMIYPNGATDPLQEDDPGCILSIRNETIYTPSDEVERIFGLIPLRLDGKKELEKTLIFGVRLSPQQYEGLDQDRLLTEINTLRGLFLQFIEFVVSQLPERSAPLRIALTYSATTGKSLEPELCIGRTVLGRLMTNYPSDARGNIKSGMLKMVQTNLPSLSAKTQFDRDLEEQIGLELPATPCLWNAKYSARTLQAALMQIIGPDLDTAEFRQSAIDDPISVAPEVFIQLDSIFHPKSAAIKTLRRLTQT